MDKYRLRILPAAATKNSSTRPRNAALPLVAMVSLHEIYPRFTIENGAVKEQVPPTCRSRLHPTGSSLPHIVVRPMKTPRGLDIPRKKRKKRKKKKKKKDRLECASGEGKKRLCDTHPRPPRTLSTPQLGGASNPLGITMIYGR